MLRFACLSLLIATSLRAASPNVVVILADDQGWGDLSVNGNRNVRTLHIDSLAADGASFERFLVQPVCSPTRAEFLTGRYHPRGGVRGVSTGGERLNLDENTIADSFRGAGYATGCFGKWHNGSQYPYHPRGRGFDEFYGFTSGHWADYFDPPLDRNGEAVKGKGFFPDDLTSHALEFMAKATAAGKPFFCYFAFNIPHSPMQVPDEYWNRFEKKPWIAQGDDTPHTRAALAMTENLDTNVGRILTALKERKLEQNTIVVYFSDNGPNGRRFNGGMRGIKGSVEEGGVRSPLFVRWPSTIPAGLVVKPIAGAIDLAPTLCKLTGVKTAATKPLDGIDLSPWLLKENPEIPERMLFNFWNGNLSVRSQQHRLTGTSLHDMAADPGQAQAIENAKVQKTLQDAAVTWRKDVLKDFAKSDPRPFPVGYREMPRTMLPDRDGVAKGGIKRSANAPNCSYFTNWTNPDDAMTWTIDVSTAGRYEAILHYTCGETDLGSSIEVSAGTAKWNGTIAKAFDPKPRGMERDRVPRVGETYMKDFQPLPLGEVALVKGPVMLTLNAVKVPGKSVADVRAVELILK